MATLCKKCRLDKCFVVGMKTSLFYSDEEIQLRNTIIAGNRKRKHGSIAESTPVVDLPQLSDLSSDSLPSSTQSEDILNLRKNNESKINCNQKNTNIAINDLITSVVPIVRPISDYSNTFNELEGNRLTELLSAVKCFEHQIVNNNNNNYIDNPFEALNIIVCEIDNRIKRAINMSKQLHSFNSICENDRLILIKNSALQIDILRLKNDTSYSVKLDLFEKFHLLPNSANFYTYHKSFLVNIGLDWESDILIINLVIILEHLVVHHDTFYCYLGNSCEITVDNRKHCKKCRLDKCLAAGMETSLIYNEKQRDIRKQIVTENRKRKAMAGRAHPMVDITTDLSQESLFNSDLIVLTDSSDNDSHNIHAMNDMITESGDSLQNQLINAYELSIMRPITDYSNQFNELESNRLCELLDALKVYQTPVAITDRICIDRLVDTLPILTHKNETQIKHVVKLSKCLNAFTTLCQSDQIVLVKYSSIEIEILRMNNKLYEIKLDLFREFARIGKPDIYILHLINDNVNNVMKDTDLSSVPLFKEICDRN
ncbi:unnamed protein product [Medioppia subpectinata]|uniref:NR LBD domain-containing protein n=1 Tax=Medioppia subpectinata TaxID=1979941 RepID=A0A7R9KTH5_9ACAR|nr:unnamed protein product [Medioppia subpectinata]CAG2109578.1 unnamed protein product [Medioppia subpectinata]